MAYEVRVCRPAELSATELEECIAIIRDGSAVDPRSAAIEVPRATAVALVKVGENVAGVGAIKRLRERYAATISQRSRFTIDVDALELGYVAVHKEHQGQRLSGRIVEILLTSVQQSALFATTDDDRMKRTLFNAGFEKKGEEWKGERGTLSLWTLAKK